MRCAYADEVRRTVTTISPDDWDRRWRGTDRGTIVSWERGREMAERDPSLGERACEGELMVLPWKGGADERTKVGWKYGTLQYLAMWQGLRGDPLQIDLDGETTLVCSRTGMKFIYTGDAKKLTSSGE